MLIGIPKEIEEGERRVALTPESASHLIELGFELQIEQGAGAAANFDDEEYQKAGVTLVDDPRHLWRNADIIMKVRPPQPHPELGFNGIELLSPGQTLISTIYPKQNPRMLERLAERGVSAIALDAVPRISRAQKMDVLSSMANIAGYRAVVEAAQHFGRFFTGQVTAAGRIPPAKVLVIGAGVAGLAAIGAAKSMGAIVRAFDTRPEVKEQVESLNAEFLMLEFDEEEGGSGEGGYAKTMSPEFIKAEMALFAAQAAEVDIIITTALIPGKTAPELITERMVYNMKPGSVIVDLAAEAGGNCKLTERNKVVEHHGVTIIGYTDLPSRLATQSSQLFATNLRHLLTELTPEKDGNIVIDMEDEVIRGCTVVKDGEVTWPPPAPRISLAPSEDIDKEAVQDLSLKEEVAPAHPLAFLVPMVIAGVALFGLGAVAPPEFMGHLTVFVLSCFIGYMVIWGVSHSLHTPLMSVTNAISSIIVIGALIQVSSQSAAVVALATVAIFITAINIFGGFAVTQRMLRMFRK